jgi:hypothetical protein
MCHQSCCKLASRIALGKEIEKTLQMIFSVSQEQSTSVEAFCRPHPTSLVLKETLNIPLIFL